VLLGAAVGVVPQAANSSRTAAAAAASRPRNRFICD
jgi:hypothetical protein